MMNSAITKDSAPVGARLLAKETRWNQDVFEIEILEWSPSGKLVKVRHSSGSESWSKDLPKEGVLIEALPSFNPAPTAQSEEYGTPI